jgi:hypothetical protein
MDAAVRHGRHALCMRRSSAQLEGLIDGLGDSISGRRPVVYRAPIADWLKAEILAILQATAVVDTLLREMGQGSTGHLGWGLSTRLEEIGFTLARFSCWESDGSR